MGEMSTHPWTYPPTPMWTDTNLCKHYLPATSFVGGGWVPTPEHTPPREQTQTCVNITFPQLRLWAGGEYPPLNIPIGGSRGGAWGTHAPPGRPNSFDFMQFSGKFGVFTPPLEGSRPSLGKILDPPLIPTPPPWTDTNLCKHYLPATSFVGGR